MNGKKSVIAIVAIVVIMIILIFILMLNFDPEQYKSAAVLTEITESKNLLSA
ncbi:hypothetical protein KP77_06260 [Jeotgalibacillus alimentarius]|uniref:Uncharacterized protein n=2 Tax=Jeotgalibacillus TaxID=157226 RepID=A0A0C2SFB2_9BACL|nr:MULTISPECIES: hypothetical protein [Jeotgalibacillus]KIL52599.1 hypothetical protein KP77_06260 [Jeotgalibacillus alimentarius]MBM7579510.1 uncharacterized protein involved in outer membrane biogenesis [Jeotgalibacillus terrae]